MQSDSLSLQELISVLRCPSTGESLYFEDGRLVNQSSSKRYQIHDGTPDLRTPPRRLQVDVPWYEPWDDLEQLKIAFPEKLSCPDLPYHLDGYLASMVPDDARGRWLLEIGCGERQAERWFRGRGLNYVGVDIDYRGVGPNVLGDGHNLPIQDDSMDYCASMAVLEHVISPITFCREVHRVLKPGGVFFGSAVFVYGFHDKASFNHMSHAGILYMLRTAGFEVEQVWPDWSYPDAVPSWSFRGPIGAPWRIATRSALAAAEWTFTRLSNLARAVVGKPKIDLMFRDISMAGSISFKAVKRR